MRAEAFGLIVVGVFLLVGFAVHVLGRRVRIPRVTLLLLLGFLASPSVFDLVTVDVSDWFSLAAKLALSIIGFQLGERFLGKQLRETGKVIFSVSVTEVLITSLVVFLILWALGCDFSLAMLLAAVAPASAPAATRDVIQQCHSRGPVTDTVLGVVAVDDAWGVILFSLLLALTQFLTGAGETLSIITHGLREVFGGIILGVGVGIPMAFLSGRIRPGRLTIVESVGFIFFVSGVAILFQLSYILACMAMGAVVSNLAKHHERPFHAIEEIEQPFLIVFFLLAGFDFEINKLWDAGLIGLLYIVARSLGLVFGGYLGGLFGGADRVVRTHAGWCLLPQAGIALGLALMVSERQPGSGSDVLSIIVGTTVVFELLGPLATYYALRHAGEIPSTDAERQAKHANK